MKTIVEYRQLLLKILEPIKSRFSNSKARIKLDGGGATYSQDVIELEAFARPLWGLVPFWIGGGRDIEFEKAYIEGLTNGSDRTSPDYWGDCSDSDQRFVEMAPIAFALLTCPEIIWEPLSEKAKDNLSSWLYQINDHKLPKWVLTQSKGIVAGIRGDIFSCVFFFCLHKRVKTCLINNSINKI